MGHSSYISVDLSQGNVSKALRALSNIPKHLHVKTAHVFLNTPLQTQRKGSTNPSLRWVDIFTTLGNMPNLTTLMVDLDHLASLPVQALTALLAGQCSSKLAHLEFHKVLFAGTEEELQMLQFFLQNLSALHTLKINACRGSPKVVESLLRNLPSLTRIQITSTAIACLEKDQDNIDDDALIHLLTSSPNLKNLSLINLPLGHITDASIQALAAELARNPHQLKELNIVSSLLGRETGKAVSSMLLVNNSIRSLTLHVEWEEDSGSYIANMLRVNRTLECLDLRTSGDEDTVTDSVLQIAHALQGDTSSILRKLRICFEFDPRLLPSQVIEAFADTMDTNQYLAKLVLTDSIEKCVLPIELRTKLLLNRSGVHRLLCQQGVSDTATSAFVDTIVMAKHDIHIIYDILSNHPSLCMVPLQNRSFLWCDSRHRVQDYSDPSTPIKKGAFPAVTSLIPLSRKAIGRRVKTFFAPLA